MKNHVLAIALGSLFAFPVFANNEINPGYAPRVTAEDGKSREDVRAELVAAQRAGNVVVNAELGTKGTTPAATAQDGKSRADVTAEVAQARRNGNYVANAELGTKANHM